MVIKPLFQAYEEQAPEELKKEILILRKLGLEDYEIEYLVLMKTKQKAREKWQD